MIFDEAFIRLLGHEGGYVNSPKDPGGETNWGISKRSYPQIDIASLSESDAKAIYRRDFWDKVRADELPSAARFDVFDAAVNSGVAQSIKWLQRSLGVAVDGVIGPQTLAASRTMAGSMIKARFNGHRLMFMASLKTWPAFSGGWARRIAANLLET